MKTLKLIEQYMNLLEQDVEQDVEQETDVNIDVEVKEEAPNPAVQSMAELIAAAFVYPPTDRDENAIEEIELILVGTHNEPRPEVDISPRSVIKSVVNKLPEELKTVYVRGPGVRGNSGFSAEDEIYFAQLLANAFRYRPKPNESLSASTVSKEYSDEEPWAVIEAIQRLLQFSDEGIEDDLQDIKIDTE
jgi:hypothetical protein